MRDKNNDILFFRQSPELLQVRWRSDRGYRLASGLWLLQHYAYCSGALSSTSWTIAYPSPSIFRHTPSQSSFNLFHPCCESSSWVVLKTHFVIWSIITLSCFPCTFFVFVSVLKRIKQWIFLKGLLVQTMCIKIITQKCFLWLFHNAFAFRVSVYPYLF